MLKGFCIRSPLAIICFKVGFHLQPLKVLYLHDMYYLKLLLIILIYYVTFTYLVLQKGRTSAKFSPRQQQVQNFPQLVIKFILKNIRTVEISWLRVRISAGRALKERQ